MRSRLLGLTVLTVVLAACGASSTASKPARPTTTTTTAAPSTAHPAALVAQVTVPHVSVYNQPNGQITQGFDNPWLLNGDSNLKVPLVFLKTDFVPGWVQVLLPVRPNDTTGWVRVSDVTLVPDPWSIHVSLSAHTIDVTGPNFAYEGPIVDGAPSTPTPTGLFYLYVLLKAPDPNTIYGPYAYGLSAHSDALTTFEGGDAEVGLHGGEDLSVPGSSTSHGCIRMMNAAITQLAARLPLGTPVDVHV